MARSKRVDDTGQPNDNRSIAMERLGDQAGFEPDWDYHRDTWDGKGYSHLDDPDWERTGQYSKGNEVVNRIQIPEHLRKIGS